MNLNHNLNDTTNKSFAELMNIEQVEVPGRFVFQSTSLAFQPVVGASAVFGGHVLGQSVVAASKTVDNGFVCHNQSSYFLKPGNARVPFIYNVEVVRDGTSYATREVRCYQVDQEEESSFKFGNEHLIYVAILSFKRPHENSYSYQAGSNPEFDATDEEIAAFQLAPDVDNLPVIDLLQESGVQPQWHPIDCRKMDTSAYNKARSLLERRIVHYFRSSFPLSGNPNIHVALLLYISDRNSLFTLINIQDDPYQSIRHVASLNHTFTLHMLHEFETDDKFIQMETWTDRAFDARGLYNGRMYTRDGKLLASFVQDGVVRVQPKM